MSDQGNIDDEVDLDNIILKVRSFYDTLPPNTPGLRRLEFHQAITEILDFFQAKSKKYQHRVTEKENEIRVLQKEKEMSSSTWKERYDRLLFRWKECLKQLEHAHEEEEKKQTRKVNLLLENHSEESLIKRRKMERCVMRSFLCQNIFFGLMGMLMEDLECQGATVFVPSRNKRTLQSIVALNTNLKISEMQGIKIEIPVRKGLAGYSFRKLKFVNVPNVYQDKRFFPNVDRETRHITKALMCAPIIVGHHVGVTDRASERKVVSFDDDVLREDKECLGVLQVLNKRNEGTFTKRDREIFAQYLRIVTVFLDSSFHLYDPGRPDSAKSLGSRGQRATGVDRPSIRRKMSKPKRGSVVNEMNSPHRRRGSVLNRRRSVHPGKGRHKVFESDGARKSSKIASVSSSSSGGVLTMDEISKTHGMTKQVEDFIVKLNLCWKKSIKERSHLQSELELLKSNLEHHEKENAMLRNELQHSKHIGEEILVRLKTNLAEFKVKRREWRVKMRGKNEELEKVKSLYLHFLEQSQISIPQHLRKVIMPKRKRSISNPVAIPPLNISLAAVSTAPGTSSQPPEEGEKSKGNDANSKAKKKDRGRKRSTRCWGVRPKDLFRLCFDDLPLPMVLLTSKFRIWRTNSKFIELFGAKDNEVLGISFAEISVGVDGETLPRLFKFDVVQGLTLMIPSRKVKMKVQMQITVMGSETTKFRHKKNFPLKGPVYSLLFTKCQKEK